MAGLGAYFRRIGMPASTSERAVSVELLRELTLAHTASIAFENLNVLMRLPVPLDVDALESKLVRAARGGYCFEQNAWFAAVLEQLGFAVTRLAARVVWGETAAQPWRNPRTHMALLVDLPGQRYLCDVGFGGNTPTAPLPFELDAEHDTPHERFRIIKHGEIFNLQVSIDGQWQDVYLFDLQPQSAIDYEMANHYVATHPSSFFRDTLLAARAFEHGRYALRNYLMTTHRLDGSKEQRHIRDADELILVLRETFGIEVPDGAAFTAALENISED